MEWIKRAWRGEERLWKVFWVYGWLLGILLSIVLGVVTNILGSRIIEIAISIVYVIWLIISLWRSAFNTNWRLWGYLARIAVLILNPISLGLIVGGIMVGQDLIKAAECRVVIKDLSKAEGISFEEYKAKHPELTKDCSKRYKEMYPHGRPSSKVPADTAPVGFVPSDDAATHYCQKAMMEAATKANADVSQYIAENQAYLKQCADYYRAKPEAMK